MSSEFYYSRSYFARHQLVGQISTKLKKLMFSHRKPWFISHFLSTVNVGFFCDHCCSFNHDEEGPLTLTKLSFYPKQQRLPNINQVCSNKILFASLGKMCVTGFNTHRFDLRPALVWTLVCVHSQIKDHTVDQKTLLLIFFFFWKVDVVLPLYLH